MAEMKKNVTTRAFIEATGKPAFQALQSEDEGGSQESGEETLSDEEGGEEENSGWTQKSDEY